MSNSEFTKIYVQYEFAGDTDAALIEDIELNCMESSKEKRMVIS